jgi:CheY-like chemotaxis protein
MRGAVRTALVIDDDEDIREVLRTMLEAGGFHVDVLTDGIDALELTSWYDVILLDWKMPVFDGQRLTDYWQLTDPSILRRVIVLSGYSRLTLDQQPPTFAILPKPFDYKALMHVVDQCVTTPSQVEASGEANV